MAAQFYFAFTNSNSLFPISVADSNGSELSVELFSDEEYHSLHEGSDEEISDDKTTLTLAFKCISAAHEKEKGKIASTKS